MQGCRRLNSLLKNPEKQIPRRAKALLVMTKIKGRLDAGLRPVLPRLGSEETPVAAPRLASLSYSYPALTRRAHFAAAAARLV
jgi:hypothetical protein